MSQTLTPENFKEKICKTKPGLSCDISQSVLFLFQPRAQKRPLAQCYLARGGGRAREHRPHLMRYRHAGKEAKRQVFESMVLAKTVRAPPRGAHRHVAHCVPLWRMTRP